MVDSTILFHNKNNYILIITNNPVFVNKKIIFDQNNTKERIV